MKEIKYYIGEDGKKYDSVEACEAADEAYREAHAKELEAKRVRKEKAEAVNAAYTAFVEAFEAGQKKVDELVKEEQKKVDEAKKKYIDLKNEFYSEYDRFISVSTSSDKELTDFVKLFNNIFKF